MRYQEGVFQIPAESKYGMQWFGFFQPFPLSGFDFLRAFLLFSLDRWTAFIPWRFRRREQICRAAPGARSRRSFACFWNVARRPVPTGDCREPQLDLGLPDVTPARLGHSGLLFLDWESPSLPCSLLKRGLLREFVMLPPCFFCCVAPPGIMSPPGEGF